MQKVRIKKDYLDAYRAFSLFFMLFAVEFHAFLLSQNITKNIQNLLILATLIFSFSFKMIVGRHTNF
jgi:hypothetical protein